MLTILLATAPLLCVLGRVMSLALEVSTTWAKRHRRKSRHHRQSKGLERRWWPVSTMASPRSQVVSPPVGLWSVARVSAGPAHVWRSSATKVIKRLTLVIKVTAACSPSSSPVSSPLPGSLPPSSSSLMVDCVRSSFPPILVDDWMSSRGWAFIQRLIVQKMDCLFRLKFTEKKMTDVCFVSNLSANYLICHSTSITINVIFSPF